MFAPVTAAQGLAARVRAHLLFVEEVAQRQRTLEACLQAGPTHDLISIDSAAGADVLRVTWRPTAGELRLPHVAGEELGALLPNLSTGMGEWLRSSTKTPDVWATRVWNRCRLMLLELSTHRSALIRMEASTPDAEDRRVLLDRRQQIDRMEQWTLVFIDALANKRRGEATS